MDNTPSQPDRPSLGCTSIPEGSKDLASDDGTLLERWAAGDSGAAALLLDKYTATLQRFFSLRMAHAADDLVQTTLLACLEGAARVRERCSFRAYLMGIARNQLYALYRKQGVERDKQLVNTTSRYHGGPSPSTIAWRRREDENLVNALRMLPISMQVILQLAYWEDFTPNELAEALDIPVSAVHSRLHRARQRLREGLEALETSSSSPARPV
jgi:RNA polymerase sigma-70 factor (ECF subfamily)